MIYKLSNSQNGRAYSLYLWVLSHKGSTAALIDLSLTSKWRFYSGNVSRDLIESLILPRL